ncbi:MAG: TVP38/TMEM64 family protein [Proteobacteria bacterium]|nr:TVP38/TMEM64 family protein [Pseudomonadota bacterium]MBU1688818.1 TVP38/TMEM64 family protein [Pseudomonadota bacterium]
MDEKRLKTALLMVWGAFLAAALTGVIHSGLSPQEIIGILTQYLEGLGIWGPMSYLGIYSVRGLILFPASLLTMTAGALFGPVQGLFLTLIGENISANLSYLISRYFKAGLLEYLSPSSRLAAKMTCYSQKNGFTLVMVSRLVFLPFDLVSYASGLCCIRHKDFALGSLIGTIPGLLTYTLLGSSFLDLRFLGLAAASLAGSLLLARHLKNKENVLTIT